MNCIVVKFKYDYPAKPIGKAGRKGRQQGTAGFVRAIRNVNGRWAALGGFIWVRLV